MIFRLEEFTGINNVDDPRRRMKTSFMDDLAVLQGSLDACLNFRLTKDGIAETRNGQTQRYSGSDVHDLWVNKAGTLSLFIEGTSLKRLNTDFSATTLATVTRGRRMRYEEHFGTVFMGNGEEMLKYKDGAVSAWFMDPAFSEEFEAPQRVYRGPVLSNILLSYYSRMYVAEGRFLFYSEPLLPETFRRSNYLTVPADITALSCDSGALYVHTLNLTVPFAGRDPEDFTYMEPVPIGAVKHGTVKPYATPFILSKRGWAAAESGQVAYLDHEHFRLDLADTAEAWLGFDPINKEIIGVVRQ